MANNKDEAKPDISNYIMYGIAFGLLGGSILSTIGTIIEMVFIQVAGVGIGFSIGMTVGVLLYCFEIRK